MGNISAQMSFDHSEPMASQMQTESGPTVMQSQASQSSNVQNTPFVRMNTNQGGEEQILFAKKPAGSGPSTSVPSTSGPKH